MRKHRIPALLVTLVVLTGLAAAAETPPRRWRVESPVHRTALRAASADCLRLERDLGAARSNFGAIVAEVQSSLGIPRDMKLRQEGDFAELVEIPEPGPSPSPDAAPVKS